MPVKIWSLQGESLTSQVVTDWERVITAEEYRQEAEALDARLDGVLEAAETKVADVQDDRLAPEFVRAWAVGASLAESNVLRAPALNRERRELLWRALARKCRLGVRADGSAQPSWGGLRPGSAKEPRREGGRLDYFELCLWLADQPLGDAVQTMGGSVRNAWQMLERPTLRSAKMKSVLLKSLAALDPAKRDAAVRPPAFAALMKALRARWPDRGPGSAKRPEHYDDGLLLGEVSRIINQTAFSR